jgi:hypothetical protein
MARLFDSGDSEYLHYAGAVVASPPVSMAAWFRADNVTAYGALVSLANDGAAGFLALYLGGPLAGDPVMAWHQSTAPANETAKTSAGYSADTWHHGLAVFTSLSSRTAYLDGGNAGTGVDPLGDDGSPDFTDIGRRGVGAVQHYMSGRIAEAAIWNAALVAAEAQILAAGYSPLLVRPQNLVAHWPLVRDEDQDRVGGYHMTAYNAPTVATHPPIIKPYWFMPKTWPLAALLAGILGERGVARGVMRGAYRGV